LTIISIIFSPLAAIAETIPESSPKPKTDIKKSSIEADKKINQPSVVEKLIQSKQLLKQSPIKTQKKLVISTSAADLDLNQQSLNTSLNKSPEYFPNQSLTENSDSSKLLIADREHNSDPNKWSAARADGHAPIGVMGDLCSPTAICL